MAYTRQYVLDFMETKYNDAWGHSEDMYTRAGNALVHYNADEDHKAIFDLIFGLYSACSAIQAMTFVYGIFPEAGYLHYFLENHTSAGAEEYELTLVKIIEAYIDADDDHRSAHRLLLDAFQASMYDKPFDLQYHSDWVKRFRSWV